MALLPRSFSETTRVVSNSGYDRLVGKRIVPIGCWAHARRRFFEALSEGRVAKVALAAMQKLYRLERQARKESLSGDALLAFRREHATPVLNDLKKYLESKRSHVLPQSLTGKAIGYALRNWGTLERYVEVPLAEIDNNTAENSIRPIALGRKNWLFLGHRNAGQGAATILSLVGTCLRLKIDPAVYLRDVIEQMTRDPSRAAELTPRRWHAAEVCPEAENATP